MSFRFGRNRPAPHLRTGHKQMAKYMTAATLQPVPDAFDYSPMASAALADVLANDQLGDCTSAGAGHLIDIWTAGGGSPVAITAAEAIAFYSLSTGYNPADPSTDQGGDEVTVLNTWMQKGYDGNGGHPIAGYVQIDASNEDEIKAACFYFGGLYFGLELPDTYTNPFPSSNGFTWGPGTPDPNQGHCIVGVGADDTGIRIDTWGLIGGFTYAAIAELCSDANGGMLFAVISKDWVSTKSNEAPDGLDWGTLVADFDQLTGATVSA
jgi:hypothetical protein